MTCYHNYVIVFKSYILDNRLYTTIVMEPKIYVYWHEKYLVEQEISVTTVNAEMSMGT